jgi:hypothetical protein
MEAAALKFYIAVEGLNGYGYANLIKNLKLEREVRKDLDNIHLIFPFRSPAPRLKYFIIAKTSCL